MPIGVQILCGLHAACTFEFGTEHTSTDQFPSSSDSPLWKHLIDRRLTEDERVSLIVDLFSDHSEFEALKDLSKDDAQFFIDAIDEVPLHSCVGMIGPLT